MSSSIRFLQFVGSPHSLSSPKTLGLNEAIKFHEYSVKNRMALHYLGALKRNGSLEKLTNEYNQLMVDYKETIAAVKRISSILKKADINHAVFKTIRPYISTTVDIDVIIFGNQDHYCRALSAVHNSRYASFPSGPMSTTFLDPVMRIGVDLYKEIAVSRLVYLDKSKLENYIVKKELSDTSRFQTLSCEADLLAIVAHSIIKENMYTLSEFFTYIYYLNELNIDRFIELCSETNLRRAIQVHTGITDILCRTAFGASHPKLVEILTRVGNDPYEVSNVSKRDFRMPHKYHPVTVVRCILETAKQTKTRRSIAGQISHAADIEFMKDFLTRFISHLTRETY